MDYPELELYNRQGGEEFTKKNIEGGDKLNNGDKNTIRLYRKKIIEQRNEIKELKEKLEQLKK
jgi:hypothetical protein